MFLSASKWLDLLFAPLTWSFLLMAASLLLRRRARWSLALGGLALVVLWLFSSQPLANALAEGMEQTKGTFHPGVPYDAVVVLGGVLDPEATLRAGHPQFYGGVERVLGAYDLLKQGAAKNALIVGGPIHPEPGVATEAQVLKDQLVSLGIEPERIVVEGRSRNTHENAVNAKPIIEAHGWKRLVLVTSAAHMPRALGCFHAVGFSPDTYPVQFQLAATPSGLRGLFPRSRNLAQNSDLLREWAGRWVYRWMGYSKG